MISIIRKSISLMKVYPAIERNVVSNGIIEPLPVRMCRFVHTSNCIREDEEDRSPYVPALKNVEGSREKRKEKFLQVIDDYVSDTKVVRGHLMFIKTALKNMKMYGVNEDLEVYKKLIDTFPKKKMVPTNIFQGMMHHYPFHQRCMVELLMQMEENGVVPDAEVETMLLDIFGKSGYPLKKYWRMMYWLPRFKNLSPWPLPKPIPDDPFILAKLAIEKISSVDVKSKVKVYYSKDIEDSIDKTWIVSAMSPTQSSLLERHPKNKPIYVEGPSKVWLMKVAVDYFILRADPLQNRKSQLPYYDPDDVSNIRIPFFSKEEARDIMINITVHEQEDGTIFAMCATGSSSKDSLLSWIRCLQKENPVLLKIPIIFKLTNLSVDLVETAPEQTKQMEPSFGVNEKNNNR